MVIIFNGVVIVKRNGEAFCYITDMDEVMIYRFISEIFDSRDQNYLEKNYNGYDNTVDPSRWIRVKKYIAKRNLEILYSEDLKYTNPQYLTLFCDGLYVSNEGNDSKNEEFSLK